MSDETNREENKVSFNYWPSSQLCMECKHGSFVMGEEIPSSTYYCEEGVTLGPCESKCESFRTNERIIANDPIEW